jgi:hypothetical protein
MIMSDKMEHLPPSGRGGMKPWMVSPISFPQRLSHEWASAADTGGSLPGPGLQVNPLVVPVLPVLKCYRVLYRYVTVQNRTISGMFQGS